MQKNPIINDDENSLDDFDLSDILDDNKEIPEPEKTVKTTTNSKTSTEKKKKGRPKKEKIATETTKEKPVSIKETSDLEKELETKLGKETFEQIKTLIQKEAFNIAKQVLASSGVLENPFLNNNNSFSTSSNATFGSFTSSQIIDALESLDTKNAERCLIHLATIQKENSIFFFYRFNNYWGASNNRNKQRIFYCLEIKGFEVIVHPVELEGNELKLKKVPSPTEQKKYSLINASIANLKSFRTRACTYIAKTIEKTNNTDPDSIIYKDYKKEIVPISIKELIFNTALN